MNQRGLKMQKSGNEPGTEKRDTLGHYSGFINMSATSSVAAVDPWLQILSALEKKINRHSYDTWFKPTRYSHMKGNVMFVRVPTQEFANIGDRYGDLIQEAIDNLGFDFHDVQFVTVQEESPAAKTPVRHDGGLSAAPAIATQAGVVKQGRFDWDSAAQLNPR